MQRELAITAMTQGSVGLIFLAILSLLLFALRKDIRQKKRLSHIVVLTLAMLTLWCFLAFQEAYFSVRKMILSGNISEELNASGLHKPSNTIKGTSFYSLLNYQRRPRVPH
jgi:hypothetical protein